MQSSESSDYKQRVAKMQMFYNPKDKHANEMDAQSILTGNLGMFACFERVEQKSNKIEKEQKYYFIKNTQHN